MTQACPKCGAGLGAGALFCFQCGATFAPAQPVAPGASGQLLLARSRVGGWRYVAVAVVAAILGLWAAQVAGILSVPDREGPTGALRALGIGPSPPMLRVGGATVPPVTHAGRREPKKMPPEIRAWLEHLERVERRRIEVTRSQLSEIAVVGTLAKVGGADEYLRALAGLEDPGEQEPTQPHETLKAQVERIRTAWTELVDELKRVPPPDRCATLALDYERMLRETKGMIFDVIQILSDPMGDEAQQAKLITRLTNLKGKSKSRIDDVGRRCDRELGAICDEFETRKWFSIAEDIGGDSGILGAFGIR